MGLLSRFGIGAKVAMGTGFVMLLLLIVTAVSYESLYAAREDFFEYRHLARQNNALGRVQANMVEIRLHAKEYLLSGAEETVRLLEERADRLGPLVAQARALFDDRGALERLETIEGDGRAYIDAFRKIVALNASPGKREPGEPGTASARERDRLVREVLDRLGPAVDAAIETMKLANIASQDALGPRASDEIVRTANAAVTVSLIAVLVGIAASLLVRSAVVRPIIAMTVAMRRLADGDLTAEVPARDHRDEVGAMAKAVQVFKEALQYLEQQRALRAELSAISTALQLAESPEEFGKTLLDRLVPLLGAGLGLFYVRDAATGRFHLCGSYACDAESALSKSFLPGEGVPGQCVASGRPIMITDLPADSHVIGSGLAAGRPDLVACIPVATREGILGVIEIGRYGEFAAQQRELLDLVVPVVALNLSLLLRNLKTSILLERTRLQADELRVQTEELHASEDELRLQREELQAANEALEDKTRTLERQAAELGAARAEADRHADEVIAASRYKSQFLASMSHELRTPLNSILLLAKALAEDEAYELSEDHAESVAMISESGNHLLSLINDILDLSKIEAGKLELMPEDFRLDEVLAYVARIFAGEAGRKGVALVIDMAPAVPVLVHADRQRFTQIMINLVGNAVKFTEGGEVRISAELRESGIIFRVRDTGIGIPADRIDHVFDAFHQLDGRISRRYGGTGLGLAICKSLVELMGGRIEAASKPGTGSTFTVTLPREKVEPPSVTAPGIRDIRSVAYASAAVMAARMEIGERPPGPLILVIEPDPRLENILRRLIRSLGYTFASVATGEAALAAVARDRPAGILLDQDLPDIPGLDLLRRLKAEAESAGIPVFVISSDSAVAGSAEALGAMGGIVKPMARDAVVAALAAMVGAPAFQPGRRRLLVVEDNLIDALALEKLFRSDAIDTVIVRTGEEAIHRLLEGHFDAVILDLMLPDMSGFSLLERVCAEPGQHPPVIVYSAHDLTAEDIYRLRSFAESVVVKGRTQGRLREEVLEAIDVLPEGDWTASHPLPGRLKGRRLLLVDDDVRNLVALSKGLRQKGFEIEAASDGTKALGLLASREFDAVLTDIMMPDMDGYELIRRIRLAYGDLPVIAATAKAMKGDAELCLQAGANDYLAKPLDLDNLLEMLDRWIE